MFLGLFLLRADQKEPKHDENQQQGHQLYEHAAVGRAAGLRKSGRNEHKEFSGI
jgi:hypothetical protein